MSSYLKANIELQDTVQILQEVRECESWLNLDRLLFTVQDIDQQGKLQRLSVIASQMELSAAHIRCLFAAKVKEITVFPDLVAQVWKVCFHGDAEVIAACGTDTLESPYPLSTAGFTVQKAVQAVNPGYAVRLVDIDGLRF